MSALLPPLLPVRQEPAALPLQLHCPHSNSGPDPFQGSATTEVSWLMLFSHLLIFYLFYSSACGNNMIYVFVFKG